MLERVHDDPDKGRRRLANPRARFAPERPHRWLSIRSEGDDGPVSLGTAEAFVPEREARARDEVETAMQAEVAMRHRATVVMAMARWRTRRRSPILPAP